MFDVQRKSSQECPGEIRKSTLTERLEREKGGLQDRLNEINKALDMLALHPEIAEVVNVISRL